MNFKKQRHALERRWLAHRAGGWIGWRLSQQHGGWYKVPGVPDWERQMTVWLNTQLQHTGEVGEGIRSRQPEAASVPAPPAMALPR